RAGRPAPSAPVTPPPPPLDQRRGPPAEGAAVPGPRRRVVGGQPPATRLPPRGALDDQQPGTPWMPGNHDLPCAHAQRAPRIYRSAQKKPVAGVQGRLHGWLGHLNGPKWPAHASPPTFGPGRDG